MKQIAGVLLLFLCYLTTCGQRLLEFNRLFNDPGQTGKLGITLAGNGYGFQNSKAHGFGSMSLTSHFYIDQTSEFRLFGVVGGNVISYRESDITFLKLVNPKNLDTYSGGVGLSKYLFNGDALVAGVNVDYAYCFKEFGRLVDRRFGVHYFTTGIEIAFHSLPLSFGGNFNYVYSSQINTVFVGYNGQSIKVWDAYFLASVPRWSRRNWREGKMNKTKIREDLRGWSLSLSVGPTVFFASTSVADQFQITDRFFPGVIATARIGSRFKIQ